MRQTCLILLVLLLSSFLNACTGISGDSQATLEKKNESDSTEFIGYVTKIENQKALVVSSINREMNQRKQFYDAVWVSNIPPEIEVDKMFVYGLKGLGNFQKLRLDVVNIYKMSL